MKKILIIPFLIISFFNEGISCTCPERNSILNEFNSKELIVSGIIVSEEVINIIDSVALNDYLKNGGTMDKNIQQRFFGRFFYKYELEIIDIFKGNFTKKVIEIYTPGNSCKFNFNVGEKYIIYGHSIESSGIPEESYIRKAYPKGNDLIWTEYCSRTKIFNKKESQKLDKLSNKKSP